MIASRVKRFLIVFVVLVLIAAVLTHFLNPVIGEFPSTLVSTAVMLVIFIRVKSWFFGS